MPRKATAEVTPERVTLRGASLQVDISLKDGQMSFAERKTGWRPLTLATADALTTDYFSMIPIDAWHPLAAPERIRDVHGTGISIPLAQVPKGTRRGLLEVRLYDDLPFATLRAGIENLGRRGCRVREIQPLVTSLPGLNLAGSFESWRIFRHGWQSWTPSLSLGAMQCDVQALPPIHARESTSGQRGVFASEEVTGVTSPRQKGTLLAGFVSAFSQSTQVLPCVSREHIASWEHCIDTYVFGDGAPIPPSSTLWSERLLVMTASDASEALATYAEALGTEMSARVPEQTPAGWCSWYYYYTNVTEADVLKNLRFLQEHRDRLPVDYIQIDDGYQAEIGDWLTPNEKFPRGMAPLAKDIKDAGFTPGIWTAPLLVGAKSRLYEDHPDWTVRNDDGSPAVAIRNWGQDCYALDTTHPRAARWLRETFREICDRWGYDYLKIDFLFAGAIAGRRRDKNATRIEAYRRGLQAIRDAAGERFILGCGALMGPSAGLVDGMRIGPDVAPWWRYNRPLNPPREKGRPNAGGEPSAENALRNIFTRAWMHNRLWVNDPDCLIARETRTKLTLPEVQSLATAIALSGGMVLFSDDMAQLSRERLDICSLLLPPLGNAPVVPDLMEESMPSIMQIRLGEGRNARWLIGKFNWVRKRRSLRVDLPPGRWHVFELWGERYLGEREGEIELRDLPSHGVALLSLRRALDRPQVIGSTFHYSMGGPEIASEHWSAKSTALRINLTPVPKRRGLIAIHVPRGLRLARARLSGERITPERDGRARLFRFQLREAERLELTFVPR